MTFNADEIGSHGAEYNPHCIRRPHRETGEMPKIGEGTWIGPFTMLDGTGGLTIGRGCDIAAGAQIYTHSTTHRCITGRGYPYINYAETVIGDHVFIGAGAIILRGCRIGNRCIVAAGSVVTEHTIVPDDSTLMGVPAKPRTIERY